MPGSSNVARIAHNLGLTVRFGGTLFGQIALNPTVSPIGEKRERGQVLNEAWGRYSVVNSVALATTILTWRVGGLRADGELRAPVLVRVKDPLLGGAAVNAILSGILGRSIAGQAPKAPRRSSRGPNPPPRPPERRPDPSA